MGIEKNYGYGEPYDSYFKNNLDNIKVQVPPFYSATPLKDNFKKLLEGKIDALVEDKNVILYTANELGILQQIEESRSEKVEMEKSIFYIAFSPKNDKSKEYAKIFTEGLKKLRASGDFERILNKYGLTDWK